MCVYIEAQVRTQQVKKTKTIPTPTPTPTPPTPTPLAGSLPKILQQEEASRAVVTPPECVQAV